jgi:hypothetical protein
MRVAANVLNKHWQQTTKCDAPGWGIVVGLINAHLIKWHVTIHYKGSQN